MRTVAFVVLAAVLGACSKAGDPAAFGDVELRTLASAAPVSLKSCPKPKCLTVYVAPWCGYCRGATPMINALAKWLEPRGVHTRVVVGMDQPAAVQMYAKDFGPDTLLDPQGRARPRGGVPNFRISDGQGRIVHDQSGAPSGAEPPFTDGVLAQIAALYRLP